MNPEPQSRDPRANQEPLSPAVIPDGRLLIDLGGTLVEVASASGAWLADASARFGSFVCASGAPMVKIAHTFDEEAMTSRIGCLSAIHDCGRRVELASAAGTGVLDGVLRTVLPLVIAPDLMMHGALLSDGERGFLCCGVSGSGKSTIASLFPKEALCDELARLHVCVDGVEARSLPFWKARPATVGLSAIFMIEHGVEHERTRLDRPQAIKALRRHVYWPVDDPALMLQTFEVLADICRDIPIFRLAFRPEPSIWNTMIEGL